MFFEAESKGHKYQVKVLEERDTWDISLKKDEGDWDHHRISKEDFQTLDDTISFMFKSHSYLVDVVGNDTDYTVYSRGSFRSIKIYNDEMILHESLKSGKGIGAGNDLTSGMPGKILSVFVKPGQKVKEGDPLLIMEAMKMENEMRAAKDGVVKDVKVSEGQNVESGAPLIIFE